MINGRVDDWMALMADVEARPVRAQKTILSTFETQFRSDEDSKITRIFPVRMWPARAALSAAAAHAVDDASFSGDEAEVTYEDADAANNKALSDLVSNHYQQMAAPSTKEGSLTYQRRVKEYQIETPSGDDEPLQEVGVSMHIRRNCGMATRR